MPTADDIKATIATYVETFGPDKERWVALFTDDATMEDPVGSEIRKGREEIAALWDFGHSLAEDVQLELGGPICVAADEAAFPLSIVSRTGTTTIRINAIDVMTFADDARITSQRAFWRMEDAQVEQG
jgi:steroid Delta-isomerase